MVTGFVRLKTITVRNIMKGAGSVAALELFHTVNWQPVRTVMVQPVTVKTVGNSNRPKARNIAKHVSTPVRETISPLKAKRSEMSILAHFEECVVCGSVVMTLVDSEALPVCSTHSTADVKKALDKLAERIEISKKALDSEQEI
jgi:hypothetical protein